MTILSCSATKCMYNDHELCSRGDIEITGDNAHRADETNCGSFRDRATAGMTNSKAHHCGCEKINIDCNSAVKFGKRIDKQSAFENKIFCVF